MKGFLKGQKNKWLTWVTLGFFVVFFAFLAMGEFSNWSSQKKELKDREFEIQKIATDTENLSQEIKEVSELDFLEKEARAKFNLKAEGEEVFVVVGLENIQKEESFDGMFDKKSGSSVELKKDMWLNTRNWLNYFFNN